MPAKVGNYDIVQSILEKFMDRIQKESAVKIYGAGKFAKTLCYFFDKNHINVEAFVVTNIQKNPTEILRRPVVEFAALKPAERTNIVVGFERSEDTKKITDFLLARQVKNIIMVSPNIINEIYCNFVIDENSVDSFCTQLAMKKKIIAYINDLEGEIIVQYLCAKGIQIDEICTDLTDFCFSIDIPVVPYGEISNRDRESFIILTMSNVYWQSRYINTLRKNGFENIILISDKLMKIMKRDYRTLIWEKMNQGFHLVDTENIENNFYVIEKGYGKERYRWRIAVWDRNLYKSSVLELVENGDMVEAYEKQFPGFYYLPYDEVPLYEVKDEGINIEVYMAKSHNDSKSQAVVLPNWIIPIQVGKALTDLQIAKVCDDVGDNISLKNVDYSEGTALYWVWKNTRGQDYIGVFHYRRQMAMGLDTLKKLKEFDVLLTIPTFVSKCIKDFFCEQYVLENDWTLMMRYIKEYAKEYYETALKYEKEKCFFPCNIFIMRRKHFDDLCQFIFQVLEKVDSYYKKLHMIRMDRYLGYLVENLLSIYLMHNAKRLKVVYTDMKYYQPIE